MLKCTSSILLTITLLLSLTTAEASKVTPGRPLNTIMFTGASVLPMYEKHSEVYVVLGREAYGKDKGKWDAWGGGRDRGESDPERTASREFYEEAILEKTIGFTWNAISDWVSTDYYFTQTVLAKEVSREKYYVMYLTMYFEDQIRSLRHRFGKARKEARDSHCREKNGIAIVRLDDLISAIYYSNSNHGIEAPGYKVNLSNGHISSHQSQILLRPLLAKVLRPYVEGRNYIEGRDPRERYYR
jgi:8-oxo-dGTP pyrophosphatase MutT (NUDIX family)